MKTSIRLTIAFLVGLMMLFFISYAAFAIDPPDNTPTIINKWVWRHVLETDDMLIIIYENTPYDTAPEDISYSEAFVWQLQDYFFFGMDRYEHGEAVGYNYNDNGYGYNVIDFYFPASDDMNWNEIYYIKLTGTPYAFDEPPEYAFQLTSADYSLLTEPDEIEKDIESKILWLANELDNKWGLTADYSLLEQSELGTILSIYGESFFRGALYGLQAYAPDIFRLVIGNIDSSMLTDRTWTDAYSENLTTQYPGSNIDTGMQAGNDFLDVDYNLFGMLLTLGLIALIAVACLMIGGDWWGSIAGSIAPMVICARLGLFGMGELALVTALCWLFFSAKMWKLI